MPRKFILLYSFFGSMLINIVAFLTIAVIILVGIIASVIVFRIVYCRTKMKIFQANLFLSLWEYVLVCIFLHTLMLHLIYTDFLFLKKFLEFQFFYVT